MSGGKNSQDDVTQTSTSEPWAPLQPYILGGTQGPGTQPNSQFGILPQAQRMYQQGPGMFQPRFNPLQLESQQGIRDYARGLDVSPAQQALGFGLSDVMSPEANPYLQDYMNTATRPIMENLQEQILPQIRRGAVATGNVGGTRQGIAEGLASRGALDAMGDITARIGSQAYGQGLDQQARALTLAPQIYGLGSMPAELIGGVGDVRQQRAMQERLAPYREFEWYNQMVNPAFGLGGTVQNVSPISGGSQGVGAVGGALSGAATGAQIGGPWGALIGGVGGGLLGAFG